MVLRKFMKNKLEKKKSNVIQDKHCIFMKLFESQKFNQMSEDSMHMNIKH